MPELLLTGEQHRERVRKSLGSRFSHHGQIFEPTEVFYQTVLSDSDLKHQYTQLCRWLGVPKTSLKVRFASAAPTNHSSKQGVAIQSGLRKNAPVCAAILARHIARVCLERHGLPSDPFQAAALIDAFTIEYGLGVVMLNGLAASKKLPYGPASHLAGHHLATKNFLAPRAYAKRFIEFTHRFHLDIASWGGLLTPRARLLLPRVLRHPASRSPKRPEAVRILDRQNRVRKVKALLVGALAIGLIGVSIFVTSNRPRYLPPELSIQREKIDQLRNLYQLCNNAVSKEQNETDQANFFIARSTEADKNRCVSLRNKYNYEVDQYNQAIRQLDL